MGNLTAKTSGELASFMTPSMTNIKSLKVHFSPKQLGTGDPSPENVREIEGWDGINTYNDPKYGGNIVWNQCFDLSTLKIGSGTSGVFNATKLDTGFRVTANADVSGSSSKVIYFTLKWNRILNHRYIFLCKIKGDTLKFSSFYIYHANGSSNRPAQNLTGQYTMIETYSGTTATTNASLRLYIYGIELLEGESFEVTDLMAIDLDIMFGTSVVDANATTVTERINWFRTIITNSNYREYNEGEITTVSAVNNEPYTNLSIDWTKNLLDIWLKPDGLQSVSYYNGNAGWSKEWIVTEELKGKTIIYSAFIDNTNASDNGYVHIWTKDIEGNYIKTNIKPSQDNQIIAGEFGWSNVKLTLTDNIYSVIFGITVTSNAIISYPMVELGLEQTEYQPYIGTIYGGYIDLISGELVEEYNYLDLSNLNWDVTSQVSVFRSDDLINYYVSSITNFICNKYITTSRASTSIANMEDLNIKAHDVNDKYIYIKDTGYTDVTEFKSSLIDCNMVYLLAEPITHQLTPTQLKSFVGQNNFWSNADYVEVEYDLIETIDIQKAKQKIILNQPQFKTISDKVVSFNTDMVAPMKNCKIYFKPIQLGTGDASITNFRDIKGWTGIDTYVNGDKISVDWTSDAGTRYGGYVDLVKGELVLNWIYFIFGRSNKVSSSGITSDGLRTWMTLRITHKVPPYQVTPENGDDYGLFSIGDWRNGVIAGRNRAYVNSTYVYAIITTDIEDLTTAEGRTAFFDRLETNNIPIEVVYKRATPLRYQLTPQQLLTFKGENHIWSETNGQQIDVTYWTRKNFTPTPLTNYLENQTWTDSAYISSSGKKTTNTVSASHFLTNQILLEAGTYVLSGFSYYAGSDSTHYRIHAYDSTGKWVKQITFQEIDNLSPVDISFTLDTDTYVNLSIAMDFDGVLAKIN